MEFVIDNTLIKRVDKKYNTMPELSKYVAGTAKHSKTPDYLRDSTLVANFYSLSEFFNMLDDTMYYKGRYESSKEVHTIRDDGNNDWVNYATYDEALEVFKKRPHEISQFDNNDISITDYEESGNFVDYDVVGDFIDVGRYLDGVPETWGSMRMGNYRGVRVKILVAGGTRASTHIDILNERSKRLCRLVDWLENQGIRVSVNIVFSNECGHADIRVKDYAEPLNIYDVAIASNGDFFRRMVFRFKELSKTISAGYGASSTFSYALNEIKRNTDIDSLDCIVLGITNDIYNLDDINVQFNNIEKNVKKFLEERDYKQFYIAKPYTEEV